MAKIMELILREDIEHLGKRGDIVQVKGGYGRNYLLPQKLAMAVSVGNRKVIEQEKVSALKRDAKEKADASQLGSLLGETTLVFSRKVGETGTLFGSVTSLDVAEALNRKGFEIDRRKILLEDPLKQLGEFQVPVRLHKEVTVPVSLQIVAEQESSSG